MPRALLERKQTFHTVFSLQVRPLSTRAHPGAQLARVTLQKWPRFLTSPDIQTLPRILLQCSGQARCFPLLLDAQPRVWCKPRLTYCWLALWLCLLLCLTVTMGRSPACLLEDETHTQSSAEPPLSQPASREASEPGQGQRAAQLTTNRPKTFERSVQRCVSLRFCGCSECSVIVAIDN